MDKVLSLENLQTVKLKNLAQGRAFIEYLDHAIRKSVDLMQVAGNNVEWQIYSDQHYELKKAKRHIQHEMGKIVIGRRNNG